jgi:hypothetical protein
LPPILTIRGLALVFLVESAMWHAGHVAAFVMAFFASTGPVRLSARATAITLVIVRTIVSPFSRPDRAPASLPMDGALCEQTGWPQPARFAAEVKVPPLREERRSRGEKFLSAPQVPRW